MADSFGVRRSAVRLVSGASSRTKIVDIDAGDPRLLASLLATPGRLRRNEMSQPLVVNPSDNADATSVRTPPTEGLHGQAHQ